MHQLIREGLIYLCLKTGTRPLEPGSDGDVAMVNCAQTCGAIAAPARIVWQFCFWAGRSAEKGPAAGMQVHMAKNYVWESLPGIKLPLILGIWGPKGCGKTFQTELAFKKLGWEGAPQLICAINEVLPQVI